MTQLCLGQPASVLKIPYDQKQPPFTIFVHTTHNQKIIIKKYRENKAALPPHTCSRRDCHRATGHPGSDEIPDGGIKRRRRGHKDNR